MAVFTFKTNKPTGKYRSFFSTSHTIKLKKIVVGRIIDGTWNIKIQIIKNDINEDGNLNCEWKWVQLKKKSQNLQEAKDFLNNNIELILQKYNIYIKN